MHSLTGRQLEKKLHEALGVEGIVPVLQQGADTFVEADGDETPFHDDSPLIEYMTRTNRPVLFDEAMASLRIPFSDGEFSWVGKRRTALALPLMSHSKLIGFLGLGRKRTGEDYTPEELEILASFTSQVAMANENLSLLEENLEKRHLEEQLQMARTIQEGFLPLKIPETPGLEVTARHRFCLEVAGDYYDVIAMKDGCTMFAVGDVSGKGAGAALLMANLQASLRTSAKVATDLTTMVAEINGLIHSNTAPEQYITFFVGQFDPVDKTLRYVNAGHNPPILLKRDDAVEKLEAGGLILGALSGVKYDEGRVDLEPGDMLLLYTDGVSEVMNGLDEEFGEERIRQFLHENSKQPVSNVLEELEAELKAFHGERPYEDDLTLLLAKVS